MLWILQCYRYFTETLSVALLHFEIQAVLTCNIHHDAPLTYNDTSGKCCSNAAAMLPSSTKAGQQKYTFWLNHTLRK